MLLVLFKMTTTPKWKYAALVLSVFFFFSPLSGIDPTLQELGAENMSPNVFKPHAQTFFGLGRQSLLPHNHAW